MAEERNHVTEVDRCGPERRSHSTPARSAKTGRGRTVMREGDLAELIDRRSRARLFENNGNVRVAAFVFHRDGAPVGDFRRAWATAGQAARAPISCSTTSAA